MSLFGTISISLRALLANQAALDTTTNNLANINTDGYTRRRAVLVEETPVFDGANVVPRGVTLAGIQSLRDNVLELRISNAVQQQSADQAISDTMKSVELVFGEGTGSIGNELNAFFNSLSKLSTDAADSAMRNNVLTAAQNLASSIRTSANQLLGQQAAIDRSIEQSVQEVNRLTSQIADLNAQVVAREAIGQDPATLADERTRLIRELSSLIDVSATQDTSGLTLTTSNGSPLVVGNRSYSLDTSLDPSGKTQIYSLGSNITTSVNGGKLGGLLQVRDTRIAGLLDDLDQFTVGFTSAINAAHRAGFDADGNAGTDLFVTPVSPGGAAAALSVAVTSGAQIAASTDGTSGGSGNMPNLLGVRDAHVTGDLTPTAFYSEMVFRVGGQIEQASSDAEAGDLIIRQLDNQRGAISGVNADEEAANLIRFQRAYQAAARAIEVVSELTEVAVNLGRN